MNRSAFTLIEAVISVIVLAIAVPPALDLLDSVAADRADAVNTTRAAMLAELVIESCLADCASSAPALGFAALEDEAAFNAGLRDRLADIASPYLEVGMDYRVSVGPLVDRTGAVHADPAHNMFRVLTVTVTYPSASGDPFTLPVSLIVGDL